MFSIFWKNKITSRVKEEENINTKISKSVAAISLSIWFILWWTWLSILWQLESKWKIQEFSSQISKIISPAEQTWYETIIEKEKIDHQTQIQQEIINIYKRITLLQQEIINEKTWVKNILNEKIDILNKEIETLQSIINKPKSKKIKKAS